MLCWALEGMLCCQHSVLVCDFPHAFSSPVLYCFSKLVAQVNRARQVIDVVNFLLCFPKCHMISNLWFRTAVSTCPGFLLIRKAHSLNTTRLCMFRGWKLMDRKPPLQHKLRKFQMLDFPRTWNLSIPRRSMKLHTYGLSFKLSRTFGSWTFSFSCCMGFKTWAIH